MTKVLPFFILSFFFSSNLNAQCVDCANDDDCGDLVSDFIFDGDQNVVCDGYELIVINTSVDLNIDYVIWEWGDDGCDTVWTNFADPVSHTYDIPDDEVCDDDKSTFEVRMAIFRTCNGTDISCHYTIKPVSVIHRPNALFDVTEPGCVGVPTPFLNESCNEETYLWTFPDGSTSTDPNPDYIFTSPGNQPVTLTVSNDCGSGNTLSDTYTYTVNVIGDPEADATYTKDPNIDCVPVTFCFENNSNQYSWSFMWEITPGNNTDEWEFIDSTFAHTKDPKVRFNEAGEYTITMTAENPCGEDVWTEMIDLGVAPFVDLEPFNETPCESYTYTPDVTLEGSIDSVRWYFEGGNPSTSVLFDPSGINFTGGGTYPVELNVYGPCGDFTRYDTIIVNSKGSVTSPNIDPICSTATPFEIMINPPGGTFSGDGITDSDDGIFDPSQANIGSNSIHYQIGPADCLAEIDFTIEVLQSPDVSIENAGLFCVNDAPYTLIFSSGGSSGFFTGEGIIDSINGVFNPSVAGSGSHDLTFTTTDNVTGCENSAAITVEVNGLESLSLGDTVFCDAPTINLEEAYGINDTGNPSVSWSGSGITNNQTGIFEPIAAGFPTDSVFTIDFTVTTDADCNFSGSVNLTIIAKQEAKVSPDSTVCISENTFQLISNMSGIWDGPGVNPMTGEIDLIDAGGGTWEYTFIAFQGTSCETSDKTMITIIDVEGVSAGPDEYFCETETTVTLSGFSAPSGSQGIWDGLGLINNITGEIDVTQLTPGECYTYTFEVVSNNLSDCEATDEKEVCIERRPEVDFEIEGSGCVDELMNFINISPETAGLEFCWDFGDGSMEVCDLNGSNFYNNAGDYEVTLTVTSFNPLIPSEILCVNQITKTIHISEPPILIDFNASPLSGCADLIVELENLSLGENLTFSWFLDDSLFSMATQPGSITLPQGRSDTTYTIKLTTGNLCGDGEKSQSFTVFPQPRSDFGAELNTWCSGDTIVVNNISYGDPVTYKWFKDGVLISSDSMPPPFVHLTDSTEFIQICLETTNNCGENTLCRDILVHPTNVDAFFNTDTTDVCVGDTVCLTNFSTFDVDALVYEWGDGNITSNPNPCHAYGAPGQYTIILRAYGCGYDSMTQIINVRPIPTADFSGPAIGCPGDTLYFEDNSQDAVNYFWDFGDGTISDLVNPSHVFHNSGNYNVCLTVSSQNECQNTSCKIVNILPKPDASFTFPDSVCVGDFVQITNTASSDVVSCFYDFGDSNTSSNCDPNHPFTNPGDYEITQIVENTAGCSDTLVQLIYVRSLPVPDFDFIIADTCNPSEVIFMNLSINADGFEWDFGDNNSSVQNNPTHIYANPGIYLVTLTANMDGICFDVFSKEIEIFERPNADFIPLQTSGCADFEVNFNAENSTGLIDFWEWDFGDGFVDFGENVSHTYKTPGTYNVRLIVKNTHCQDTTFGMVTVHEPVAAIYNITNVLCSGNSTGAIDIIIQSGTSDFNFEWSNGEETEDVSDLPAGIYGVTITDSNLCIWEESIEITEPNPITLKITEEKIVTCYGGSDGLLRVQPNGGIPPYQIQWSNGVTGDVIQNIPAGNYGISVTDANGCLLEDILTVSQNDSITVIPTIKHITCHGDNDGEIKLEISDGFPPYFVTIESIGFQTAGNFQDFNNLPPGDYDILIEDAHGCTQEAQVTIIEPTPAFVDIQQDSVYLLLGASEPIVTFYQAINPSFSWFPSIGLDCTDCAEPIARPFETTRYRILLTDENGCEASDTVYFEIDEKRDVYIPNIFTPNDDGRNDVFRVRAGYPSVERVVVFRIFDRWGEMVFEEGNYDPKDEVNAPAWDGTFNGEKLSSDVFMWYAEIEYVDGETERFSGDVTLVR